MVLVLLSVNAADAFLGNGSGIGSAISLISKSDIRYEGTLNAMDLREETITLTKVRSFGTEDRPTSHPVPMKDEIYEFLTFKASDIKSFESITSPNWSGSENVEEWKLKWKVFVSEYVNIFKFWVSIKQIISVIFY